MNICVVIYNGAKRMASILWRDIYLALCLIKGSLLPLLGTEDLIYTNQIEYKGIMSLFILTISQWESDMEPC